MPVRQPEFEQKEEFSMLMESMEKARNKINMLCQEVPLSSQIILDASIEYDNLYTTYRLYVNEKMI